LKRGSTVCLEGRRREPALLQCTEGRWTKEDEEDEEEEDEEEESVS